MHDQTAALPAPETPRLYSIDQAADILDVSPRMVWQLIRDGALSRVKFGAKTTKVRDDELAALVERMTDRDQ